MSASQAGYTSHVLLSCGQDQGSHFLESALLAGVIKPGNSLLLPCLGLASASLDRFRYSGAEMTVLKIEGTAGDIELEQAYILDLLTALTEGILSLRLEGYNMKASKLSCADTKAWQQGLVLVDRIRNNKFLGRSGTVTIDSEGQRVEVSLSLLELGRTGLEVEGVWTAESGYLQYKGTARAVWSGLTGSVKLGRRRVLLEV